MMYSFKKFSSGHNLRFDVAENFSDIIDVMGSGIDGKHVKKIESCRNYMFSVVIENCKEDYYFSEKIINPMLCGCTPVYLGCSEIDTYIPSEGGILKLTGDVNQDIQILYKIINNPTEYKAKHTPCRAKVREITCLAKHLEELF